jgi:chromate transporter
MAKFHSSKIANHDTATIGPNRPALWKLFLVWTCIGIQSFGGGSATILLIRREFIERHTWLSEEEYERYWSLCQLSPGIILVAMVILIGRKLRSRLGIIVSLAGMLLPSAIITCLFSAGFVLVQAFSPVQAMMRGVIPATAGLMLTIALQFALPPLKNASSSRGLHLIECLVIMVLSALAISWWHIEIVVVVLGAILLSLGVFYPLQKRGKA